MQKQMRDTSLTAFCEIQPELSERSALAYQTVAEHPEKTAYELAKILGHSDPNYIRPRLTELAKDSLIFSPYKRVCNVTKRLAYVWRVYQR